MIDHDFKLMGILDLSFFNRGQILIYNIYHFVLKKMVKLNLYNLIHNLHCCESMTHSQCCVRAVRSELAGNLDIGHTTIQICQTLSCPNFRYRNHGLYWRLLQLIFEEGVQLETWPWTILTAVPLLWNVLDFYILCGLLGISNAYKYSEPSPLLFSVLAHVRPSATFLTHIYYFPAHEYKMPKWKLLKANY